MPTFQTLLKKEPISNSLKVNTVKYLAFGTIVRAKVQNKKLNCVWLKKQSKVGKILKRREDIFQIKKSNFRSYVTETQ